MTSFEHLRHKPPTALTRPREIVIACSPMRSNVNLSNIVRTAGCCGITRLIACGSPKIDKTIARDGAEQVNIEVHRTLRPVLKELKAEGYRLVGLEQATNSISLHNYRFERRTALGFGHAGVPAAFRAAAAEAIASYLTTQTRRT
jgi:tRNA G18 (ribose-2'-O)-methylase SpoU